MDISQVQADHGPVSRLLSWRALIPFGRLTFGAYLVNGIVELHSIGTLRNPRYLSVSLIAKTVFANTLLTFIGGLLLTLMLESPIIRLQKILLESVGRKPRTIERDTAEC